MADNKLITLENMDTFVDELKSKYTKKTDYDTLKAKVDDLVEGGGEPNKIEIIKVNGQVQTIIPDDKSVDIDVPEDVSELNNDLEFQTKKEVDAAIDAKIGSAYKAAGSVEASHFSTAPSEEDEGKVYNASEQFTTNTNFVDNDGKTYPAGTNVVVVSYSDTYKYDVLAGFVDLSDYATTANVASSISSAIDDLDIDSYAKTTAMESYVAGQLASYYTSSVVDSKLEGYVQSSELEDYVDSSELSSTLSAYVRSSDIVEVTESEIRALFAD